MQTRLQDPWTTAEAVRHPAAAQPPRRRPPTPIRAQALSLVKYDPVANRHAAFTEKKLR